MKEELEKAIQNEIKSIIDTSQADVVATPYVMGKLWGLHRALTILAQIDTPISND